MGLIDGLPVGLSIVGRPGDEPTMLAVAAHFERALGLVASGALTPHFIAPQRG
jgi:Asp-tRNA(Asn)/Glu-tRNA(Gln) amidotransferase A subunit family amidase